VCQSLVYGENRPSSFPDHVEVEVELEVELEASANDEMAQRTMTSRAKDEAIDGPLRPRRGENMLLLTL
jgi:hypothetical protein